jgi:uncharacterized protein (TIRG00374 family)
MDDPPLNDPGISSAPTMLLAPVSDLYAPPRPASNMGLLISWGSGIVLLTGLLTFILHFADMQIFAATLRQADRLWLAAALVCQVATYICAASVWQSALRRMGAVIPFRHLLGLALVELFANQAIPTGGLSGSVIVVRGLAYRGVKSPVAITALLVAALSYYVAYLLVALVAFILLWHMGDFSNAWAPVLVVFVGVVATLGGTVLALTRSRGGFIPAFALKFRHVAKFSEMLEQVRTDVLRDGRVIFEAVALQASIFLLDAATLWFAARSVDLILEPQSAIIGFLFASIVATLSPIPMGLGTFEGTCIGLLHFLGASVEASLAATLILRGFTLWLPMLPGLWLIRHEATRVKTVHPTASHDGTFP